MVEIGHMGPKWVARTTKTATGEHLVQWRGLHDGRANGTLVVPVPADRRDWRFATSSRFAVTAGMIGEQLWLCWLCWWSRPIMQTPLPYCGKAWVGVQAE